jgi:hypothetical protein
MIAHKTFTSHSGLMAKGMARAQEEVRAQAEAFIARELDADDVISIAESALPSTWSKCLVSVTVWYSTEVGNARF